EKMQDILFAADIGLHGKGESTGRLDFSHHLVRGPRIRCIVDADRIALSGGLERDGAANAPARSGDDDAFFWRRHGRLPSLCFSLRLSVKDGSITAHDQAGWLAVTTVACRPSSLKRPLC